jgi:hypothetical protein
MSISSYLSFSSSSFTVVSLIGCLVLTSNFIEKLIIALFVNKSPSFIRPECYFRVSKAPTTCPYHDLDKPSSQLHNLFIINCNLSFSLYLGLPSDVFPSGFWIKILCAVLLSSVRLTCFVHFILLDFITLMFGQENTHTYMKPHLWKFDSNVIMQSLLLPAYCCSS